MAIKQTITDRTHTSLFLLPGIGLYGKNLKEEGFINAFISDKDGEHHSGCIYVLFKPKNLTEFTSSFLEKEYKRTDYLIDEYDYDGGYVVLVYKFPQEFALEYKLFLKGKYSQFRASYKNIFPDEIHSEDDVGPFTQPSFYHHVFNRTKELEDYWFKLIDQKPDKDGEYWSIPNIEAETLDISKIQQTV